MQVGDTMDLLKPVEQALRLHANRVVGEFTIQLTKVKTLS